MPIMTPAQWIAAYNSGTGTPVQINVQEYMSQVSTFARPTQFKVVQEFFSKATITAGIQNGVEYTAQQMASILGVPESSLTQALYQKDWNVPVGLGFSERLFIFNSGNYQLGQNTRFVLDNGIPKMINTTVIPLADNFDYQGGGLAATMLNPFIQFFTDPFNQGHTVPIEFIGTPNLLGALIDSRYEYTLGSFNGDNNTIDSIRLTDLQKADKWATAANFLANLMLEENYLEVQTQKIAALTKAFFSGLLSEIPTDINSYHSYNGALGNFDYGSGMLFALDESGRYLVNQDILKKYLPNGDIVESYKNSLGDTTYVYKNTDGSGTIFYKDSNGISVSEDYTSISDLSPEGLLNWMMHDSGSANSLEVGVSGFFSNLGQDPGEWITSEGAHSAVMVHSEEAAFANIMGTVSGETYFIKDIAKSFIEASAAIGNFINNEVNHAIKWFTASDGANIAFAQWLGANMQDLVNGDLDSEDAFIDLAGYLASQFGVSELQHYINGMPITLPNGSPGGVNYTAAHQQLNDVLKSLGVDADSVDALSSNISMALARFGVDFVLHSGDWNSDDYVNAGMMATTSVISQHYAETFLFSKGSAGVPATVAAVANIVSTLMADHDLNTREWMQLGATTGVAAGSAWAGSSIATFLGNTAWAGVAGPVGILAGAVIGLLGSKILEGIFGSKKYYPGEFASKAEALNSLYTVQQIDDGNGNMVNALIATNSKGSTLILKSNIVYAIGGSGSDTLVGDGGGVHQDNVLAGNAGDDYLEGKFGNDTLFGDAGHDHILGGVGNDLIIGGEGNDELIGDEGDDTILADAGDDFVHGGSGNDAITGGDGDDIILAGGGGDIVDGGKGRDIIELGAGDDIGEGDDGDDTIMGNIGNDNLIGGKGNDQLFGEFGNDQLTGGDGSDYLDGGADVDILQGEVGDDYLIGGLGNDALDGGLGNDRLKGGDGNDTLLGGLDNDLLIGDIGADDIQGGDGNDVLVGGVGDDTLNGGAGDDIYFFNINAGHGDDQVTDGGGNDRIVIKGLTSTHETLYQDGDDLIISYGNVSGFHGSIRLTDHFVNLTIETLELDDCIIDLANISTYDYSNLNTSPTAGGIENQISQFEDYQSRKEQELGANALLSNIGTQTYHEAMRDDLSSVYYNAPQVEAFKRSRGMFGGHYSVYKLVKPTNIYGEPEVISYKKVNPGDSTVEFDRVVNATKVVYNNKHEIIEDIWFDGKIISTTHIVGSRSSAGVAGEAVINHNSSNNSLLTAADRLLLGTQTIIQLGEKLIAVGADQLVGTYWAETLNGNSGNDYLYGGDGNDIVNGGSGNDWIFGGGGNDALNGGAGDDILLGGVGNDTIYAGDGDDAVMGGDGDDVIYGEAGNDWLDGGAGNDIIVGGLGDDLISGGTSSNTATFAESTAAMNINLLTGIVTGYGNDILINIEKVTGSTFNDVIVGSDNDNVIDGGVGADAMSGGKGNDIYHIDSLSDTVTESLDEGSDLINSSVAYTLGTNQEKLTLTGSANINGTGNGLDNTIIGNSGVNVLYGYAGNDTLDGGLGIDTLVGGQGDDIYYANVTGDIVTELASEGIDTVMSGVTFTLGANVENLTFYTGSGGTGYGNTLDNILVGYLGSNTLYGYAGNDTLDGGAGNDTLVGGLGDDIYFIDSASDVVTENASEGTDIIKSSVTWSIASLANIENLTLTGAVVINGTGNALNNIIIGNSAANTLNGGAGIDTLSGGDGDDIYIIDTDTDIITESVNEGSDTIQSSVSYILGTNIENLTLTGSSTLNGTGNDLDNHIQGTSAANTLIGNNGNDILHGYAGNDTMIGGLGDDTYNVDVTMDIIIENTNEGTDTILMKLNGYVLPSNVENLTFVNTTNISGHGNELNNVIIGNSGQNTIYGHDGDDTIDGGNAIDTLYGGLGDDTYITESNNDVIVELANEGIDTVIATVPNNYTLSANVENLILMGTNSITLTGNALDNSLTGNSGANTFNSGGGNDTFAGKLGNDIYIIANSLISIIEAENEGTDLVQASVSYTLADHVDNLTLTGSANINGAGNNGNNLITGNTGVNILTGNDGDDTFDGAAGIDTFIGGEGNDTYIIDSLSESIVENADEGSDTIRTAFTISSLLANVENVVLLGTTALNATGNTLDNVLTGNSGANQLYGLAGNDTLDGGSGNDTLVGGTGDDIYVVDSASDVVTESLGEGTDTIQSLLTWTIAALANIENLTLLGTSAINATGNSGNNTIKGNSGVNLITGGGGEDTMMGEAGNDTYIVDSASDVVVENISSGTDLVQSSITYTLTDNVENLTLTGSLAINGTGNILNNIINGNTGNNTLDGGIGADTLIGGTGDDIYLVDHINDIVTESASSGTDEIRSSVSRTISSNVETLILVGSANINAAGDANNNILIGNTGNNLIEGFAGNDTMIGGLGDDTYTIDVTTDVIIENNNEGTDTILMKINGYVLPSNVENLTFVNTTNISGHGNELNNVIIGNSGQNTIYGYDGNDTIDGGNAIDTLYGGLGDDTYITESNNDVIVELANEGIDHVYANTPSTYVLGSNLENLTLTGTSNIGGTGNALDNIITGNSGNNTLIGGVGSDTLIGGEGNDTYIIDASGLDLIVEALDEGLDVVQSSVTYTLTDNVESLILTGASVINGTGNNYNNTLTGNSSANILDGGTGNDTMIGGLGDDIYIVDSVLDVVTEASGAGADLVRSYVTIITPANVENITLLGNANINATGGSVNNTLIGNSGDNILDGGAGTDTLTGGLGNDIYIVDTNLDVVTENANEGIDTIHSSVTINSLAVNVENALLLGTSATNANGNALNNIMTGNSAVNQLLGYDGNDILDGGAGNDLLVGGLGDDTYFVDSASDVVAENASEGTDTVKSSVTWSIASLANIEHLTLIGTAAINGTGNALNNIMIGNTASNTLNGGAGNDSFIYNYHENLSATDIYYAENGVDTLELHFRMADITQAMIDDIADYYSYINNPTNLNSSATTGSEYVFSEFGLTAGRFENVKVFIDGVERDPFDIGNIIYGTIGDDSLDGTAGNDIIFALDGINDGIAGLGGDDILIGGPGECFIIGGNGNDVLISGIGADSMMGESGADTYLFTQDTLLGSMDTIYDFTASEGDKLDLSDLLMDYTPGVSNINDYVSIAPLGEYGGTALIVDRDGAGTSYEGQGVSWLNGSGASVSVDNLLLNDNLIVT